MGHDFRRNLQRNLLRKPICHLWGHNPPRGEPRCSGWQMFPRAAPRNPFCIQLSSCLLEEEMGDWEGSRSLPANPGSHSGALPVLRFVANGFSVLFSCPSSLGDCLMAPTPLPCIWMLSLISATGGCLGRLRCRGWQKCLMREKTRGSLESRMGTVKLFLTLKSWS